MTTAPPKSYYSRRIADLYPNLGFGHIDRVEAGFYLRLDPGFTYSTIFPQQRSSFSSSYPAVTRLLVVNKDSTTKAGPGSPRNAVLNFAVPEVVWRSSRELHGNKAPIWLQAYCM